MNLIDEVLNGVVLLESRSFRDERGYVFVSSNTQTFTAVGISETVVQDNHAGSVRGTFRGLHYQSATPQAKLIQVLIGEILDVVVDLRRESPTFGRWHSWILDASLHRALWVPAGFAHGFVTRSEWSEIAYKCTAHYDPASEVTIRWDDADLAIDWQLADGQPPCVSAKDARGVAFRAAPTFLCQACATSAGEQVTAHCPRTPPTASTTA